MSNTFAPLFPPPKQKAVVPPVQKQPVPQVPVQHPELVKPTGPPVKALLPLGYAGSIFDFNKTVENLHAQALATNGAAPDPQRMLSAAITPKQSQAALDLAKKQLDLYSPGWEQPSARFLGADPSVHGPASTPYTPFTSNRRVLQQFVSVAKTPKDYARAWDTYGDSLQTMLADPKYHNDAMKAIRQAEQQTRTPATGIGLGVGQVIQGLVYAPVGIAKTLYSLGQDIRDTQPLLSGKPSNNSYSRTREIAKALVESTKLDFTHPHGRYGLLFLDILTAASLGGGVIARAGRAGAAFNEAGVKAAGKAFVAPHPLETMTLSKEGYEAQLKLAQNPFLKLAQKGWYEYAQQSADARAARLGEDPVAPSNWLHNVTELTAGRIGWANPWGLERTIGRAENIRLTTETAALGALSVQLHDVAGSAARRTRLASLIPDSVFKGLTAPEMEALVAYSFDISEDLNPLEIAERNAHEAVATGLGDEKAWKRHLALIQEARKTEDTPTPRFVAARNAIAAAVADMEAIKADAGWLTDQTMENRIIKAGAIQEHFAEVAPAIDASLKAQRGYEIASARARKNPNDAKTADDLERAQTRLDANPYPFVDMDDGGIGMRVGDTVVPLNRNRDDSWYMPFQPKSKGRKSITQTFARTSPNGLGPGLLPAELRHEMTGAAFIHGDYRIDVHHLAGEQLAKTAKAFVQWTQWLKAWENGGERQEGYIAVRDIRNVPDELRRALTKFMDETPDIRAVDALPEDLQKIMFPDEADFKAGEHVRWIDPRVLGQTATEWRGARLPGFEKVNSILRPLIFYLYPKYVLNGVGNAGMLTLDEGFIRSSRNLVRAINIDNISIGDDASRIVAQVGGGRSSAYALATHSKVNQALAEFWNSLTDEKFRVASFLHYADIKGYASKEARHELLTSKDPAVMADLVDVSRRANEALVAFDRMSNAEKAWLRHLVFVYPWQRGAFLWSFRSIFEHPAKTTLLTHLGDDAYHDEKWLQHASLWVKRTGYLPLGWAADKAHLRVYNDTSVNTFATLAQAYQTTRAIVEGDKYATLGDFLGPPGQMAVHAFAGRDEFGNKYTGGHAMAALKGAMSILPVVAAYKRSQKPGDPPLPTPNIADRSALIKRYRAYQQQAALDPGALDGWGRLIWGADATLNVPAVVAKGWLDASPRDRHIHEQQLIHDWMTQQGVFLGKSVPSEVRKAQKDAAQYSWALGLALKAKQDPNATLTQKEKLVVLIDYYQHAGRFTAKTGSRLRGEADKLEDPREIASKQAEYMLRYGNAKALAAWDRDVRNASGAVNLFDLRISSLHALGLSSEASIPKSGQTVEFGGLRINKERLDYARAYINYQDGRRELSEALKSDKDKAAQLRIYDDKHDHPVGRFPSVVRFQYSEGTPEQMAAKAISLVAQSWKSLSRAEKALMGRDVSQDSSVAWASYDQSVNATRERDGSVTKDQRAYIAAAVEKEHPGFQSDYLYAQRSKAERLTASPLWKHVPDRDWFSQSVVAAAKQIGSAMRKNGDPHYYRSYWHKEIDEQVVPLLGEHPELQAWLKPLGGVKFLYGLVNTGGY